MSEQKKGILPTAAIVPALLAMHKAVTGYEVKPKEIFFYCMTVNHEPGPNDTASETIRVTPEMIQVANVIFMQYSQMAKMMVKG